MKNHLIVPFSRPCEAMNGGLFASRGEGIHPTRVIDSHELIFVRRGRLGMFEEDRTFDLTAGQTLLLWPGRKHGGTADYPPDLSFYWIHFRLPRRRSARNRDRIDLPQTATLDRPERMVELFGRFLDDQETGRLTKESGCLLVLLMLQEVAQVRLPHAPGGAGAAMADRARRYIKLHAREAISTSSVAAELRCNPDYLGRVYRAVFGESLTDAIHHERIREARSLLMDGQWNVDEVARRCGFTDSGYFRRRFRRLLGMSPREFRSLYARVHMNVR